MSSSTVRNCKIWGTTAAVESSGDNHRVESARSGGKYLITDTAVETLKHRDDDFRAGLTSWLVEQRRLGDDCPKITSYTFDDVDHMRQRTPQERADGLLRYISAKSEFLGDVIKFFQEDNSKRPKIAEELLAWTASQKISEVITLAEFCANEGWIEHKVTARPQGSNAIHEVSLRPQGYSRLAELNAINTPSESAFVAMWFDPEMDDAYGNGIRKGIVDAGYRPVRIDQQHHNNKIDDEIIAEIRRSRFLVADFTQGAGGARGGVYYEAVSHTELASP